MRRGYSVIVGFLALMFSTIALIVVAMADVHVESGEVDLGGLCVIPVQNITLEPAVVNTTASQPLGFEVLYYKCNYTSCSGNVSVAYLPPEGGSLALGPSLLHMVLLKTSRETLPPSVMKSVEPGVLELNWFYPVAVTHAILVVEANSAILFLPGDYGKLPIYVPGCSVIDIGQMHGGELYNLTCSYNIAAGKLKLELVESKLKSIVVDVDSLGCTSAVGVEVVKLRLPALAAATLLAAALAAIALRESKTL
ncbi:hypothetical protein [Hyperthermus butylicus]|uniref:Uncharacterized protein n=1 Tax=Hyperthermus butylicus (strain DSM 5456 / JCM 9403 / PLM1-5) TaxID=415426 RepID=A2BL16_HYPBU|nr:hypothetical protein [Hyperthermus butylicus]ABM80677.1 hypothetical protein Hbut_0825 [Hyperthermus butylicus DSM 5456]